MSNNEAETVREARGSSAGGWRRREMAGLREANALLGRAKVAAREGPVGEVAAREMEGEAARLLVKWDGGLKRVVDAMVKRAQLRAGEDAEVARVGSGVRWRDVCWAGFCSRMYRRDLLGAAAILWPEHIFTAEPWSTKKIWAAMDEGGPYVSVLGAGAVGKSFVVCVRLLMEWAHDPLGTRVDLVTKNEDKMRKLFADFANLWRNSVLVMPGEVEAQSISADKIGGFGIFQNLVAKGTDAGAVLKGTHGKAREARHPVFGVETARYVLVDEAQDVEPSVFNVVGNILTSTRQEDGKGGRRRMRQVVLTANPALPNSAYGEQCKPVGGWGAIDAETTEEWRADKGAWCVRVDALKTENVRERRDIYPGLVGWAGVQQQLAMCDGNENHPVWWTYVRGFFPPEGAMATLVPQRWLTAAEGEWIFDGAGAEIYCGFDVARLGGDSPAMAFLRVGRAVGWRDYSGQEFKLGEPSWRVQLDNVFRMEGGDTQEVADDALRRLRDMGVRADCVAVDVTGSAGVFDLMTYQWRAKGCRVQTAAEAGDAPGWHEWAEPEERGGGAGTGGGGGAERLAPVMPVNFAARPTELRVAVEDSGTPRELYANRVTEMWFALAKYFELGYIKVGRGVSRRALEEIGTRKAGKATGKGRKQAVEPKAAHKRRLAGGSSPDEADAVVLALAIARMGCSSLRPKARDTAAEKEASADDARREWRLPGEAMNVKDLGGGFAPVTMDALETERRRQELNGGGSQNGEKFAELGNGWGEWR